MTIFRTIYGVIYLMQCSFHVTFTNKILLPCKCENNVLASEIKNAGYFFNMILNVRVTTVYWLMTSQVKLMKAKHDRSKLSFTGVIFFCMAFFKYKPMLFSQSGDSHTLSQVDNFLFKPIVTPFCIIFFLNCRSIFIFVVQSHLVSRKEKTIRSILLHI